MEKPTKAYDISFSDENLGLGWTFGAPPGIQSKQWPRSRVSGIPMAHLWTFAVPEQYRTKGPEYVAISFFQADDANDGAIEKVRDVIDSKISIEDHEAQGFWNSLKEYAENRHAKEIFVEDIIGGGWALIWLTKEEFEGGYTIPPDESIGRYPGCDTSYSKNPYGNFQDPHYVKIEERLNDPNVGKDLEDFPDEDDENAYIEMYSDRGEELGLEEFAQATHFGGTANPIQATPEFSPFYIEFEEHFGDSNMGSGNGQFDLLNDQFDWACG